MTKLAEELLLEFLFQKTQIAKSAGVKNTPAPNWTRAAHLWGKHMETVARVVEDWNIPAPIIMQAAFEQAKRNRHPDGPQVSMLKSEKYLTNALSFYLDLPVALIVERKSMDIMLGVMDKEFAEVIFPADLLGFTIENPCFRYVEARRRNEDVTAALLAPVVLSRLSEDRRMDKWMTHRNLPYMEIAQHYHQIARELMMPQLEEP